MSNTELRAARGPGHLQGRRRLQRQAGATCRSRCGTTSAGTAARRQVFMTDFNNIRFTDSGMGITIAFVPDDVDISTLKPPADRIALLGNPGDLDDGHHRAGRHDGARRDHDAFLAPRPRPAARPRRHQRPSPLRPPRRRRLLRPDEGGRAGRWVRHPAPAADPHHAQAAAARSATARSSSWPWPTWPRAASPRWCCRSASSPTPSAPPTPTARASASRLTYAVEPEPLDTAGAIRFAARAAGHRRHVRGGERRRAHRPRRRAGSWRSTGRAAPRARSTSRPVEDPSAFGVVPTDDQGRVEAFIEKPAARRGADQPHQRRHLRARAVGARPDRSRRARCRSSGSPSRPWWPTARLFALATDDYWLDTGRPDTYRQANLDVVERRRAWLEAAPVHPAATVDPTAQVCRSVVGEGAVVGRRRPPRRRRAAARARGRCRGAS